jgi:uncharacterized protein YceK
MAFRTIYVALLLSSLPSAGCGTIANLVKPGPEGGGKSPFGGVKHDVSCIEATNGECDCGPSSKPEQYRQVALKVFWAADLPFSVIGDVVTWPYTATYSYINQPIPIPPLRQGPPLTQVPPATQATTEGRPQTSP